MKTLKVILSNLLVLFGIFVLLEGGLRVFYAYSDEVPPHADHSVVREWRWVSARLADGKVNFDRRFVHDQWAGWKNAPNIDTGDIRTNAHFMRNDEEFPIQAEPGRRRMVVVGDSYSFGHAVSNEDTFTYMLGKQYLPDWDVMNLAVSASGTDQNLIMYERYGAQFRPDVVLLGFYVLDYNRNPYSFRDYAKPMFVPNEDGSLTLTHSPVMSPEKLLALYQNGERQIGGWHYSYVIAGLQKFISNRIKRNRSEGALSRRLLTGIMERFINSVRANGGQPLWVVFPIRDIVEKDQSKYEVIELFAEAEAKRLGMPILRLEPIFRDYLEAHPDALLWNPPEVGGHLSPTGHALAAQSIHEFLKANGMLDKPALSAR